MDTSNSHLALETLQRIADEVTASAEIFEDYSILRVGISRPGVIIFVYTWGALDRLFGQIYRDSEIIEIFDDPSTTAEDYGGALAANDFAPPPDAGTLHAYPWEPVLDVGDRDIYWSDAAAGFADLEPVLYFSSTEACR